MNPELPDTLTRRLRQRLKVPELANMTSGTFHFFRPDKELVSFLTAIHADNDLSFSLITDKEILCMIEDYWAESGMDEFNLFTIRFDSQLNLEATFRSFSGKSSEYLDLDPILSQLLE